MKTTYGDSYNTSFNRPQEGGLSQNSTPDTVKKTKTSHDDSYNSSFNRPLEVDGMDGIYEIPFIWSDYGWEMDYDDGLLYSSPYTIDNMPFQLFLIISMDDVTDPYITVDISQEDNIFYIFNNSFSAIDLSIASASLGGSIEWSVQTSYNSNDHWPITLKLLKSQPTEKSTPK
ncbi:Hypothetical protein CINCED_3A002357 [Cinara cedri]|uniref:Endonuclease/exonuclease/phosphatase n=1 Tax=Cinara cedri TaxID=506608 RepID=A0A5E4N1A8_9HEMI|nr:Hypothetical protein CINCED_3A002357 [Cinara cedri]